MTDRKKKVEDLLTDLRSLRRAMTLQSPKSGKSPRITPSQWGVLMVVEQHGRCTVKSVSEALGISSSAATQLVDGLSTNGYLKRETSSEDRRTVMLVLSKKSEQQMRNMKAQALRKFLKLFEVLSDREFDRYFALNKKIVNASFSKKDPAIGSTKGYNS
jgi:DNA-binding MarR family transcriptional regulator